MLVYNCKLFQASQEDITNAYRKLSRIYHPDKHPIERKKQAEVLFNKTKKAYEGKLYVLLLYSTMLKFVSILSLSHSLRDF